MRSWVLVAAAAAVIVLASPASAPAAVQTAVQCPASVGGGYDYVAAKTHWMLDDPTFLSIFCDYVNPSQSPDQSLVELQVFWSVQAPRHGCPTRAANNQTILSDSKFASVSWGTGNAADPPDLQNAVQRLLRAAEAEAASCSGDAAAGAGAATSPAATSSVSPPVSTPSHNTTQGELELIALVGGGMLGVIATMVLLHIQSRPRRRRSPAPAAPTAADALATELFVAEMIDTVDAEFPGDPEKRAQALLYGPSHPRHHVPIDRDERLENLAASMDPAKLDAAPQEVRDYIRRRYGK